MTNAVANTATNAINMALAALEGFADGGKPFFRLNGSTGVYHLGKEQTEVTIGSEVAFNMKSYRAGWVCWKDSKVVEQRMSNPFLGEKPMREEELPDHGPYDDEEDGWKKSVSIDLRFLDLPGNPEATFNTTSAGGVKAVTDFFKLYLNETRLNGDNIVPIVPLETDFYIPKDKKLGKKFFPVLKPVEWTTEEKLAEQFGAADDAGNYEAPAKEAAKQIEAPKAEAVKAAEPPKEEAKAAPAPAASEAAPAATEAAPAAAPGGRRRRF